MRFGGFPTFMNPKVRSSILSSAVPIIGYSHMAHQILFPFRSLPFSYLFWRLLNGLKLSLYKIEAGIILF
jgi:hypothetical protein